MTNGQNSPFQLLQSTHQMNGNWGISLPLDSKSDLFQKRAHLNQFINIHANCNIVNNFGRLKNKNNKNKKAWNCIKTKQNWAQRASAESTNKGVNQCSKHITWTQQQRPASPTVALTWHTSKLITQDVPLVESMYFIYSHACQVRVTVGKLYLCILSTN